MSRLAAIILAMLLAVSAALQLLSDRALLAFGIIWVVGFLVLTFTRRVIIAWMTYFSLRNQPRWQKPSARRWLWIKTLRVADGKDSDIANL